MNQHSSRPGLLATPGLLLMIGLLTVGLSSACGPAPLSEGEADEVVATEAKREVVLMLSEWGSSFGRLDWARAASFYSASPDFEWIEEGEVRYRSRAEIQASLEGVGSSVKSLEFELIDPSVEILGGDHASLSALFSQTMDFGGEEPFLMEGAITAILHRSDEGWRFLRGHTSTQRSDGDSAWNAN